MNRNHSSSKRAKKGTFKRLMKYVFKLNSKRIIFVLLFMIIATISNVGAMSSIQNILVEASNMIKNNSRDFSGIIKILLTMVALYASNMFFTYSQLKIMISVGQDTLFNLRTDLFNHMMTLPVSYFDKNKHGDLMSRYTNDVDATRQMISQSLPQLILSMLMITAYLIAMIVTSYILAIVTVLFTSLLVLITRLLAKSTRKYFFEQQENVGNLNGYIEEMIEGQKVVKVFRHEKQTIEGFSELNKKVAHTARISVSRSGMLIPITVNLGFLGFAIAAIAGAYLVSIGHMQIEQLIVYLLFTRQFTGPLNQMGQQLNFVQMALAGSSRVFEVMDLEPEIDNGTVTLVNVSSGNSSLVETKEITNKWAWKKDNELIPLKGDIRFNNVTFGYNDEKIVLSDISLFAKPGQKIAFVGATGAGKTTITNLINRFYDINDGVITFDGINIKEIKKSSLRQSLGMVLQDTHLFSTTVMENIRYGKLNATDNEVIEAAKLANAHEFIKKLPKGYQTLLTDDGANLSEGQRQLLSIARVAISNPPVLILDEATSSIDTYTEKLINDGMDKLMENRTVFVIAHRLSTIKNSKAIMILSDGEIVERGNHDDLIDLKGIYYQLFTGAFELE